MATIIVEHVARIARPIDVVRAQFGDIPHHIATRVHRALAFSDARQDGAICRFTLRRRMLGLTQVDELELERLADGNLEARIVAGANVGVRLLQLFVADGADATRVTLRLEYPATGLKRLLAPLLRVGLRRDLVQGLEEDRVDLESGRYPSAAA